MSPRILEVPGRIYSSEVAAQSSLLTSIIAYWKLGEASGNTRVDSVNLNGDNRSDAAENGGSVTTDTGLIQSNAMTFTSVQGFEGDPDLKVTDNADIQLAGLDWTLSLWLYWDNASGWPELDHDIFIKNDFGTSSAKEFNVYIGGANQDGETLGLRLFNNNSSFFDNEVAIGSPRTQTWIHFVVWVDETNNMIGQQINHNGSEGTPVTNSLTNSITNEGAPIKIGAGGGGSTAAEIRLAEIGLWGKVLSAAEITSLFNMNLGLSYPF